METSAARAESASRPSRGRSTKSAVTNGKRLHVIAPGDNAWNRRFRDLVGAIISDLGGDPDQLSEGQKQLCRRAAGLALECEKIEALACGAPSAVEEAFRQNAGGLSSRQILGECARILHMVGRLKAGEGPQQMAAMARPELDHVVDLLTKAADIASKAASAGAETAINVELYGTLCDRLGRVFGRLGLERRQREVESLSTYLERKARELPEEVPPEEAQEAVDLTLGLSDSGDGKERATELPTGNGRHPSEELSGDDEEASA